MSRPWCLWLICQVARRGLLISVAGLPINHVGDDSEPACNTEQQSCLAQCMAASNTVARPCEVLLVVASVCRRGDRWLQPASRQREGYA